MNTIACQLLNSPAVSISGGEFNRMQRTPSGLDTAEKVIDTLTALPEQCKGVIPLTTTTHTPSRHFPHLSVNFNFLPMIANPSLCYQLAIVRQVACTTASPIHPPRQFTALRKEVALVHFFLLKRVVLKGFKYMGKGKQI